MSTKKQQKTRMYVKNMDENANGWYKKVQITK